MNTEEIMEMSTEMSVQGETLVDSSTDTQFLESIAVDVRLLTVLALLTFITSCFRGWRKNTVKGGK